MGAQTMISARIPHPRFLLRVCPTDIPLLYKTLSAAVYGIDANITEVEVGVSTSSRNENRFHTVGLPDAAARESHDRVRAALKNCGYNIPHAQIAKVRWLVVPEVNTREAAMVGDVEVCPVKSLVEVTHLLSAGNGVSRLQVDAGQLLNQAQQVIGS